MIDVTLEQAYREACTALGEALVRERLMQQHLAAQPDPEAEAPNE